MAALNKNGTELYRLVKHFPDRPDQEVTNDRTHLAIMSNGKVLKKRSCRFSDRYSPKGYRDHTWGWKVYGKVKTTAESVRDMFLAKGYSLDL